MLQRFDVRCQVLPSLNMTHFKLGLLSGEMQSLILSLLLQGGGLTEEEKWEKYKEKVYCESNKMGR